MDDKACCRLIQYTSNEFQTICLQHSVAYIIILLVSLPRLFFLCDFQIDEVTLISVSLENSLSSIGGLCLGKAYVIDHQVGYFCRFKNFRYPRKRKSLL